MMWDYGYGAWWMWIPGLLLTLLVVAGIVVLIVLAVRSSGRPHDMRPADHDAARRILDERLARGEITPEQYRELHSTLDEGRRP
ncbi:SHOCT domain-containing protein [Agromyces bauzanensis]